MSITALPSRPQFQNYTLAGGATVSDRTDQLARIVFCTQTDPYKIFINGRYIYAAFCGSRHFTFEMKDSLLVKITEIDQTGPHVYYVGTNPHDSKSYKLFFGYFPKELTLEEAKAKLSPFSEGFVPDTILYNHHGVVVIGINRSQNRYELYRAFPNDTNVHPVADADITRTRSADESVTNAVSAQEGLCTRFDCGSRKGLINDEPATRIDP